MPPRKRKLKVFLILLAAAGVLWLATASLVLALRYPREERLLQTIEKYKDLPRTLKEARAKHSAELCPRKETAAGTEGQRANAATILEECMPGQWEDSEQARSCFFDSKNDRRTQAVLRGRHPKVLDRLLHMPEAAGTQLPLTQRGDLDSFDGDREWNTLPLELLLGGEAESRAEMGDFPGMVSAFRALAAMRGVLQRTPAVDARCRACSTAHSAAVALSYVLRHKRLPNSVLDELEPLFQFDEQSDVLRTALLLYRDFGQFYVGNPYEAVQIMEIASGQDMRDLTRGVLARSFKVSGLAARDRERFLSAMGDLIAIADSPSSGRISRLLDFQTGHLLEADHLQTSSHYLNAAAGALIQTERARRLCQVIQTVLAVERFRNHTGQLPETLDVLTPDYWSGDTSNIHAGEPLLYSREETAYAISSIVAGGTKSGPPLVHDVKFPPEKGYNSWDFQPKRCYYFALKTYRFPAIEDIVGEMVRFFSP